jgi:hypothetical protein
MEEAIVTQVGLEDPCGVACGAGDDRLDRARVFDEASVVRACQAYPPFSSGDLRMRLPSNDGVQLTLVYGPSTEGIESATLLMRRM